jgi:hypothetical protein
MTFGGDLPTGFAGRPLVREWFVEGTSLVQTGCLMLLNSDIIVSLRWIRAAAYVFRALNNRHQTLIFGVRSDVYSNATWASIVYSERFMDDVDNLLTQYIRGPNQWGMDAFLIHSTFSALQWHDFPDFVIDMCVWDNFFIGWSGRTALTVTMEFNPPLFHINHQPNACNYSNYEYFLAIGSHHRGFSGWPIHTSARVHLRFGSVILQRDLQRSDQDH